MPGQSHSQRETRPRAPVRPGPDPGQTNMLEIYDALRHARFVFWVQCPPKSGAEARRGATGRGKARHFHPERAKEVYV